MAGFGEIFDVLVRAGRRVGECPSFAILGVHKHAQAVGHGSVKICRVLHHEVELSLLAQPSGRLETLRTFLQSTAA